MFNNHLFDLKTDANLQAGANMHPADSVKT